MSVNLKIEISNSSESNVRESFATLKEGEPLTFGRSGTQVVLKDDRVSKSHCSLEYTSNKIFLVDNGSTNGTIFNGKKIDKVEIEIGDSFNVGDHLIEVSLNEEESTSTKIKASPKTNPKISTETKTSSKASPKTKKKPEINEDILTHTLKVLTAFVASPLSYLEEDNYSRKGFSSSLQIIVIFGVLSGAALIFQSTALAILTAITYPISMVGYVFALEFSKKFTSIEGDKDNFIAFFSTTAIVGIIPAAVSLIPIVGGFSVLLQIILFVLVVKAFFRVFKAKVIQIILVTILYGFIMSVIMTPVSGLFLTKAAYDVQPSQIQDMLKDVIKAQIEKEQ